MEISVEWKNRHIRDCGGTDEERKLLRDMPQPHDSFCLPFSPAPRWQNCYFGSAQVLVVLESDWTYPSPTLN